MTPRPDLILRDFRTTGRRAGVAPAPPGGGRPVLLVPGLFAPNSSLDRLARWLTRSGWVAVRPELGMNVQCSAVLQARIVEQARRTVAATGHPLVVVGHSRGGLHAKVLAAQHPELVDTLVTLGSPLTSFHQIRPSTRRSVEALRALHRRGGDFLGDDCWHGRGCCADYTEALLGPLDPSVRFYSLYAVTDRVVLPEACLDPGAVVVEVQASHQGMAVSGEVWKHLADFLSQR